MRADKWLWHARVAKTRTLAASLVTGGHVRLNSARISKASQPVKPGDVEDIIQTTLREGKPIERLCEKTDGEVHATQGQVPFYRHQRREIYQHCGRLDPRRLDDALAEAARAFLKREHAR